jgi:hypothetical protein
MARRNRPRNERRRSAPVERPFNPGSHWRADGAPKTAYRSQGEALGVADEQRQDSGVVLSVYQCEYCSSWHMGNSSGRRP